MNQFLEGSLYSLTCEKHATDMKETKIKDIALSVGKELTLRGGARAGSIIERVSADIAARVGAQGLSQSRFRLGKYLLRAPDYQQILLWAEAMDMLPTDFLLELSDTHASSEILNDIFSVQDGSIASMCWCFEFFPAATSVWVRGLQIRELVLIGQCPDSSVALLNCLPDFVASRLTMLGCEQNEITELDLSSVPGLTRLACVWNKVTELDLSSVPGLTELDVSFCQLTKLDLSPVPGLTKLYCSGNQLTELDLSPVPGLTVLDCSGNQLTELDLASVPGLTVLDCSGNQLTELDLSPVPGLTVLTCSGNQLTALDLSPVSGLTTLLCRANGLTELDLTALPRLSNLHCDENQLTELDLSPMPGLTTLRCEGNQLTELDLSPVQGLTRLHCTKGICLINVPSDIIRCVFHGGEES